MLIDRAEDVAAAVEAVLRDALAHVEVAHGEPLARGVAAEAERAGLVSRVVPAAELLTVTLAAAQTICEFSGPSIMMAKECVNRAYEGTLADGVMFERRMFHSLFATEDQKEGMDAFVNKRKPVFKQR
jgi:enoyl-CoA hydratase